jgi:hypothetical protein
VWLAARAGGAATTEVPAAARALGRTQAWIVLLLVGPTLVHTLASYARPGATRPWLAGGASSLALALGLVAGSVASALALCALVALGSEAALPDSGRTTRLCAQPSGPKAIVHDGAPSVHWRVERAPEATHARLTLGVAQGGGPNVALRWTVRDGAEQRTVERKLARRGALELELPPASGAALECELERLPPGALALLGPDALELVAPAGSERRATLAFGAHAALALTWVVLVSLVLARALPPLLATLLALSSFLLAAKRALGAAGALVVAFDELGLGRVPSFPTAASVGLVVLAAALASLLLSFRADSGGSAG